MTTQIGLTDYGKTRKRLKDELQNPTDPVRGWTLREALHSLGMKHYVPRHSSSFYFKFLNKHICTFARCDDQSTDYPHYMSMFCVAAQWAYGDTVEECIDNAVMAIHGAVYDYETCEMRFWEDRGKK